MCHFYICLDVHDGYKEILNSLKTWADYLFPSLEEAPEEARLGVVDEDILQMKKKHDHGDVILKEDDGIYEKEDILKSFHHHSSTYILKRLLAAFCQFG